MVGAAASFVGTFVGIRKLAEGEIPTHGSH
jgi:hypothetical protein